MVKVSPLKLTLVLLIVKDSKPEELVRNLSYYTSSSNMQVMAMLRDFLKTQFIRFNDGAYELTPDGYTYLFSKGLGSMKLDDILEESTEINEKLLYTYIPNKE
ncbi:hypothetical protein A9986_09660 [Solibacillus silvestris]|nr:hypothetical protein [Solibacillus silvestris]OBW57004.1 hypothetical protein A9986_09660 [Solibacillus silvestris]